MGGILSHVMGGVGGPTHGGPDSEHVVKISSSAQLQDEVNKIKDSGQLMVIDFYATWCGPCNFIKPAFNGMALKYPGVKFFRIDVDEVRDVAEKFGVQAMPTFVLVKKGGEVARVVGAKMDVLEKTIKEHDPSPAFAAAAIT